MNLFQLVFASVFLLSLFWCILQTWRGRVRRVSGIVWSLIWVAATVAVLCPELASRVAHLFGIGRGADFVLYVAVILGLYVAVTLYAHLRRLEVMVTELFRLRTLDHATLGGGQDSATSGPREHKPGQTDT